MNKFKGFNIRKHKGILMFISFIVSIAAFQVLLSINKSMVREKTVPVLIAKSEIEKDSILDNSDFEVVNEVQREGVEYLNKEQLKDVVAVSKIFKGDLMTKDKVREMGIEEKDGKVIYSIKLDPPDAVAGTLRSGDKVNIIAALPNVSESGASFLFEENGVAKGIKIKEVYDSNSVTISDENVPASIFSLELDEDEARILRSAEITKKIKLVLAKK